MMEEYLIANEAAVKLAPEGRAKYNKLKQSFFEKLNLEDLERPGKSG